MSSALITTQQHKNHLYGYIKSSWSISYVPRACIVHSQLLSDQTLAWQVIKTWPRAWRVANCVANFKCEPGNKFVKLTCNHQGHQGHTAQNYNCNSNSWRRQNTNTAKVDCCNYARQLIWTAKCSVQSPHTASNRGRSRGGRGEGGAWGANPPPLPWRLSKR